MASFTGKFRLSSVPDPPPASSVPNYAAHKFTDRPANPAPPTLLTFSLVAPVAEQTPPHVPVPAVPSPATNASLVPPPATNPSLAPAPLPSAFDYDRAHGYDLEWEDRGHFDTWLSELRRSKALEFRRRTNEPCRASVPTWLRRETFRCTRDGDSRKTPRERKRPEQKSKQFQKELEDGCPALITIKTYPGTTRILGRYRDTHSHDDGAANLPYMTLSKGIRAEIREQVHAGVPRKAIHKNLQSSDLDQSHVGVLSVVNRDKLVSLNDIGHVERKIKRLAYALHKDDDQSVVARVEKLKAAGHHVFLKRVGEEPPEGSSLEQDVFLLVIQTNYQREAWYYYGHDRLACIDATHNTTAYESMSLFSIVLRDDWGHGLPAAYMVSSNATENTIRYFLGRVKSWSPEVVPREWMSDRDPGQINAILAVFTTAILLLCRWHVLHAWYQHFNVNEFGDLWPLLRKLVYATTKQEFDGIWLEVRSSAPVSVVGYMETYWMTDYWIPKWATYLRSHRTIFEESETNMLAESWHHLLKHYFGEDVRNRRVDQLAHILTVDVEQFMQARHQRQLAGMHGHNLEQAARVEALQRAASIPASHIQPSTDMTRVYRVRSQSAPAGSDIYYNIDATVSPASCSCPAYYRIAFCKHVAAVGFLYPSAQVDLTIRPPTARSSLHPQLAVPHTVAVAPSTRNSAPVKLREMAALTDIEAAASTQLAKDLRNIADDISAHPL